MTDAYSRDLDRNAANFQPLTPLSFLKRSAEVFPEKLAVVHGPVRHDYATFYARSRRLASALIGAGVQRSQTVAALLLNTPAMLEAHYGVPMMGGILNALPLPVELGPPFEAAPDLSEALGLRATWVKSIRATRTLHPRRVSG